jgi:hypothetical protein
MVNINEIIQNFKSGKINHREAIVQTLMLFNVEDNYTPELRKKMDESIATKDDIALATALCNLMSVFCEESKNK